MGLAMGPDGALSVSDTEKGKIWKIGYKGNRSTFRTAHLAGMEKRKMLPHIRDPDELRDDLTNGMMAGGAKVYATYCLPCHQPDGKGDGNRFPPLAGSEWVTGNRRSDKERLIKIILNGMEGPITVLNRLYNNTMPANAFLSNDDIAKVLTYIRNNFGNKAAIIAPADVSNLRNRLEKP